MPVCSYLIHAAPGERQRVVEHLRRLEGCEPTPAADHDLIALVTDTRDGEQERALQEQFAAVEGIRSMTLTFGEVEASGTGEDDDARG